MDKQYGHIVYTRCGPGWNLEGREEMSGGFGIHTLSSDIPGSERDAALQQDVIARLARQDSYWYFVPDIGAPMLGHFHVRTQQECDAAKAASQDPSRNLKGMDTRSAGVGEWLVGEMQRYPVEYIDSPYWQADQRPMAYYYENARPLPMEAPVRADEVPAGAITRQRAAEFAGDGRVSAVQAAVWALMTQFDQPEGQRKFIVIRDSEANVRLWVAAILYALPLQAAAQVSFNTAAFDLNQDTQSTYYVMKSTRAFVRMRNIQDPNQERRPFAMIAGADPADSSSSRTANPMASAPYLVIDGQSAQARFETDDLMNRAYLQHVVIDDATIDSFCGHMSQMQDVRLGSGLCDLFDACVLLDDQLAGQWKYASIVQALGVLEPHFTARSVLMKEIINRMCIGGEYLSRAAAEDERAGLKLFGMLLSLANRFGFADAVAALKSVAETRLAKMIGNPDSVAALKNYIQCLRGQGDGLYEGLLQRVVGAKRLAAVNPQTVADAPKEYVVALFGVLGDYLKKDAKGWPGFFADPAYKNLADALIQRSAGDAELTGQVLSSLKGDRQATEQFILRGTAEVEQGKTGRWWDTLLGSGISAEQLCETLRRAKISDAAIEEVLCAQIKRQGKCTEDLRALFGRYLDQKPTAGGRYFATWKRQLADHGSLGDYSRMFTDMGANYKKYGEMLKKALQELDEQVRFDQEKSSADLVKVIRKHAVPAAIVCSNAEAWAFMDAIANARALRRGGEDLMKVYQEANPNGMAYTVPRGVLTTPLGQIYLRKMLGFQEEPAGLLVMLLSFNFADERAWKSFLRDYASEVTRNVVSRKSPALAMALYVRAVVNTPGGLRRDPADALITRFGKKEVLRRLDDYVEAVRDELEKTNTGRAADELVKRAETTFGRDCAEELKDILDQAREAYEADHHGGSGLIDGIGKSLGGLFGRIKKK